jgi:hypothetical protein
MIQERPLPRFPLGRAVLIVVSFAAFAALLSWLAMRYGGLWPTILFLTPAVIGYFYYYRRRCPECGNSLAVRRDFISGTRRFRLMMDCVRCQIAWDTGQVIDEEQSGGD